MAAEARLGTVLRHLHVGSRDGLASDEVQRRRLEQTDSAALRRRRPIAVARASAGAAAVAPAPDPTVLQCAPLTPDVGAEVVGAVLHEVAHSPSIVQAVDAALLKHKVLVFRGVRNMDTQGQLRLIRALNAHWGLCEASSQQRESYKDGAFVIRMLPSKPGTDSTVWPVENLGQDTPVIDAPLSPAETTKYTSTSMEAVSHQWPYHKLLERAPPTISAGPMARFASRYGGTGNWTRRGQENTRATNVWHSDDNYVLEPPWCTVLRALEVPPCGGDTLFADMGLAFADLAPRSQHALRSLAGVADWRPVFPNYRPGSASFHELRKLYPMVAHPLIRTHPSTGDEVLYCNAIYTRGLRQWSNDPAAILGSAPTHADELLRELLTLPGVPEYQCRVRWHGPDDLLLWDNRRLQHYAAADYRGAARRMEHCASLGAAPYLAACDHSGAPRRVSCLLSADLEWDDMAA